MPEFPEVPDGLEWQEDQGWDGYEVNRQGDQVFLIVSRSDGDGEAYGLAFDPEDAQTVGLALAQAGQEALEEST